MNSGLPDAAPTKLISPFIATPASIAEAWSHLTSSPLGLDDVPRAFGPDGLAIFCSLPSTFLFRVSCPRGCGFAGLLGGVNIVPSRTADVQIHLWGRHVMGAANDHLIATPALLFGFLTYGLARMNACIPAANRVARKYAERQGFRQEGRMTRTFLINKMWYDGIMYGLLREDFLRKVGLPDE